MQVFEETAEGDAVIASDEFELNRLIDFKSPGGKKTAMFPINSILLEVDDCWYISEALYCRLYCVRSYYGDFLTLVNDDNDLYRNKSATAFSQTIAEERQKLSLLEDRVKDLWSQKQKSHFEILLNDKKSRIQLVIYLAIIPLNFVS